jgi:hypothetical protein
MVNDILFHIFYATEPTWFQNYGNAIRIKDWFSSVDNKPKYPIFNENDVKKGLSFNKNKEDIKPSLEILIRHNFIREIPGLSTISEYIVRSDIIESPLLMQKLYDDQNTCNLVKNMMDQELNNNYTQNIQPQFPQTMPNAPVQLIGQYPYLPNMSFPSQQTNSFQYPQNTMNIPVQQSVQLALPMQVKDDIASYIPQFLLIAKRDNQISELIYNYLINQQDILLNGIEKHIVNKFNDDKILDSTFNTYVITILHAICDMIKNHLQNCGYLPSNNNLLDMITTYLYINQNEYPY